MNFKGTIRRTLAMLLVLIFALSNMGLAEVAEQIADVPATEAPSIEEVAVPEEASEEAEEAGEAEAEPEAEEEAAPAEPAEEPAEEAAAPESVTVEVMEIDETSLCAYESIAPEGIWEVSYAWERATSADGEWEALDETSDVYSTDAEDRFDYVYRCTVSVGEMSATSAPVAFSGAEYVDEAPVEEETEEPVAVKKEFDMQAIAANTLTISVEAGSTSGGAAAFVQDGKQVVLSGGSYKISIPTVDGDSDFKWTWDDKAAGVDGGLTNLGAAALNDNVTISDNAATVEKAAKHTLKVSVTNNGVVKTGSLDVYVLPKITQTYKFKVTKNDKDKTPIGEDKKIGDGEELLISVVKSKETKAVTLDPLYGIEFEIMPNEGDTPYFVKNGNGVWAFDFANNNVLAGAVSDAKIVATASNDTIKTDIGSALSADTGWNILPRPGSIKDATEGVKDLDVGEVRKITLVDDQSQDATDNKVTLKLDVKDVGGSNPATKANTWFDIEWKIENDKYDNNSKSFVDIKKGDGDAEDTERTFTVTQNTQSTPDGKPIKVTVTGRYWSASAKLAKVPDTVTYTYEITVLAKGSGTLEESDIIITPTTPIGQAAEDGEVGKSWGLVTASLNSSNPLSKYPQTWEVDSSAKGDSNYLTPAEPDSNAANGYKAAESNNTGLFMTKKQTTGLYATDGEKQNGHEVTIKVTVNNAGTKVEATKKVKVLPAPDGVSIATVVDGTASKDLTEKEGSPVGVVDATAVAAGSRVTLRTALKNKTYPAATYKLFGSVTSVSIQRQAEEGEGTQSTETLPVVNGADVTWNVPQQRGTYKVTATASTGAESTCWFKVLDVATEGKITSAEGRKQIYATNTSSGGNGDTLKLTLEAKSDAVDEDGNPLEVYTENITWRLESSDLTLNKDYLGYMLKSDQSVPSEVTAKIYLKKETGDKANQVTLHIDDYASASIDDLVGKKLTVKAELAGSKVTGLSFEVTIAKKVDVSGIADKVKNVLYLDGKKVDTSDENNLIAQGETLKLAVDTNKGADAAEIKAMNDVLNAYTLVYKLSSTKIEDEKQLAKWIAYDSEKNELTAGAASKEDKNQLPVDEATTEEDGKTYQSFKMTITLAGVDQGKFKIDVPIRVVPAPASVAFKQVTADGKSDLPWSLRVEDSVTVTAELRGPELKTKGQYATTHGKDPVVSLAADSAKVKFEQLKDEKKENYINQWKITNNLGGSNVAILTTDLTEITTPAKIWLTDEEGDIVASDGESCTGGGAHSWTLVLSGKKDKDGTAFSDDTKFPSAAGHYYYCMTCGDYSKIVKHSTKNCHVMLAGKDEKEEDVLTAGYDKALESGVFCEVCAQECNHSGDMIAGTEGFVYKDAVFHWATCPDCGLRVLEKHNDPRNEGLCADCGNATAVPEFTDAYDGAVIVPVAADEQETYEPKLTVKNTRNWNSTFEIKSGTNSGDYITLVNAKTGEIRANKATPENSPVVLIAHVTAKADNYEGKPIDVELQINVRNVVSGFTMTTNQKDETVTTDQLFVIEGGELLELSVDPGELTDLRDYVWSIETPEDETLKTNDKSTALSFVKMKKDGTGTEEDTAPEQPGTIAKPVPLSVKVKASGVNTTSGYAMIKFAPKSGSDNQGKVFKINVAVLKKQTDGVEAANDGAGATNEDLNKAFTFDGKEPGANYTVVAQGSQVEMSLTTKVKDSTKVVPFNMCYSSDGKISWQIIPDKTTDAPTATMQDADANDWFEVIGNTLVVKKAATKNILNADRKYAEFFVIAKITLDEKKTENGKTQNVVLHGKSKVRVVAAPASVEIQQKVVSGSSTWKKVDGALDATAGDAITLRANIKTAATNVETIGAEGVVFNWGTGNFVQADNTKIDSTKPDTLPKMDATEKSYTVTIDKDAPDTITIPVTCPGVTIPDIVINVKRPYSKITLNVTPDDEFGAGETYKDENNYDQPYTVTVEVTTEPATNADDSLTWNVYATADGVTPGQHLTGITLNSVANSANKTFTVPSTWSDDPGVLIVATATKGKVQGKAYVKIYKTPVAGGLEVETGKTNKTVTVGELVEVTKHGYITEDGYGSKAGALITPTVVESTLTDETLPKDTAAASIVEKDGKVYVKGEHEGKFKLQVEAYNGITKLSDEITVAAAISGVDVLADKLSKDPYKVVVDQSVTIPANAFSAYRINENDPNNLHRATTDAAVTLEARDPSLVTITKNAAGDWVVTGKSVGETELYGVVGEVKSETTIPITVNQKPTGIKFYYTDTGAEVSGTQIIQKVGETSVVKLTAKAVPAYADGKITINSVRNDNFTSVPGSTGDTVEVTPAGTKGSVTITAEMENPTFDESRTEDAYNSRKLYGYVEIVVVDENEDPDTPTPPTPPTDRSIQIVGKKAIGPQETTRLAVIGAGGRAVTWESKTPEIATVDAATGTVTGVAAGKATIASKIDGIEDDTVVIDVLTAPVVKYTGPTTMSNGEVLKLTYEVEDDSYIPAAGTTLEEGAVRDTSGLVSFSMADNKFLKLKVENDTDYTLAAIKAKGSGSLVMHTKGAADQTFTVTVQNKKNTQFSIGTLNGATLYMAEGTEQAVTVTYKPKNVTCNLAWTVVDSETGEASEGVVVENNTVKAVEAGEYDVTVSAAGYARQDQGFKVIVTEPAAEGDHLKVAVDMIGGMRNIASATDAITVFAGEKLQARLVNADDPETAVGGKITWSIAAGNKKLANIDATSGVISALKKSGAKTVDFTAAIEGVTGVTIDPIKVTVAAKPGAAKLVPNSKTRTVAMEEPFQLELTNAKASGDWYNITWSQDLGAQPVTDDETGEAKAGWYTMNVAGQTLATLQPAWGGTAQKVSFTVVDATMVESADQISLPEKITLPKTGKVRVKATFEEGTYANLVWTVGNLSPVVSSAKATGTKGVKAKLISNNEIEIQTTKASEGVTIKVATAADPEIACEPVNATIETAVVPAGLKIVPAKAVIGVGETTELHFEDADGETVEVNGALTFACTKHKVGKKNVAGFTANGTTITGKKADTTTPWDITLKVDGQATDAKGQIYVTDKATITTDMTITKMAEGEVVNMGITIGGYTAIAGQEENMDLSNLITVENNSEQIKTELSADEEDETGRKYILTLSAVKAVKNAKGKYTTASIKLNVKNGAKAKTLKIQVVEPAEGVYFPLETYIGPKDTIALNASYADGTNCAANIHWEFDDPDQAKAIGLEWADGGKLHATESAQAGQKTGITGITTLGEDEKEFHSTVIIGNRVTKGNQIKNFKINLAKTTIGVSEKLQATIDFSGCNGYVTSAVKWSIPSSKKNVAIIDKNTGLITAKGIGSAKITATIKGKKKTATITVVADPTGVSFKEAKYTVAQGTASKDMRAEIAFEGYSSKASDAMADYESALTFTAENDTGIIASLGEHSGIVEFTAVESGSATIVATTANGLTAETLLMIGDTGSGGTGPDQPGTDVVPKTIEIRVKGTLVDGTNPITLKEGETVEPVVVVKDANDRDITASVASKIAWSMDGSSDYATLDAATGKLTAVKGTSDPLTVRVAVTDTDVNAWYKVSITSIMSGAHIDLYRDFVPMETTVIRNTEIDEVYFNVESGLLDATRAVVKIENLTQDVIELYDGSTKQTSVTETIDRISKLTGATAFKTSTKGDLKIKGLKKGVGQVKLSLTCGDQTYETTKDITVSDLPTADEITITVDGKAIAAGTDVVLGQNEPGEVLVTLPEAYGKAGSWQVTANIFKTTNNEDGKPVAWDNGDYSKVEIDNAAYAGSAKAISGKTSDGTASKFTIKATKDFVADQKYRVRVEVFSTATDDANVDPIYKDFTVQVKKGVIDAADVDVKIDGAAKNPATTSDNVLYAAVGESFNLSLVAKKNLTYTKGLSWRLVDDDGAADPKTKSTLVLGENGSATLTGPAEVPSGKNKTTVTLALIYKGIDNSTEATARNADIGAHNTTENVGTYEFNFVKLPESGAATTIRYCYKDGGKVIGDAAIDPAVTPIVVGVNETLHLDLSFTSPDANNTKEVIWTNNATKETKTGNSVDFKFATSTGAGSLTLSAAASNGAALGSVTVKVLPAPSAIELKKTDEDGTTTNDYDYDINKSDYEEGIYYVKADLKDASGNAASSSLQLSLRGNNKITSKAVDGKKNVWEINISEVGTYEEVTLVVRSADQNLYRAFNLKVTNSMTAGELVIEAPKAEDTKPNGFVQTDTDGKTIGATEEQFEQNQNAVTATMGSDNTITITADEDDVTTWTSTDGTKKNDGNRPWYCLVIDTGYDTINGLKHAIGESSSVGQPSDTLGEDDVADAVSMGYSAGHFVLWIDLTGKNSKTYEIKFQKDQEEVRTFKITFNLTGFDA